MRRVLTLMLLVAAVGCASAGTPDPTPEVHASSGHGYALLYEMLEQERQVAQLLLIKVERDSLETVIRAIAKTCDDAYERLVSLGKADPGLDLVDTGLPIEEVRTRQAIAATRRDQLLAASGRELELQLLLTPERSADLHGASGGYALPERVGPDPTRVRARALEGSDAAPGERAGSVAPPLAAARDALGIGLARARRLLVLFVQAVERAAHDTDDRTDAGTLPGTAAAVGDRTARGADAGADGAADRAILHDAHVVARLGCVLITVLDHRGRWPSHRPTRRASLCLRLALQEPRTAREGEHGQRNSNHRSDERPLPGIAFVVHGFE